MGLDEVLTEALLSEVPRPGSLPSGSGLLVILRGIDVNADADPPVAFALVCVLLVGLGVIEWAWFNRHSLI